MIVIGRTQQEIDAVLSMALEGELYKSFYPNATFEEGVRAMWEWLTGYTNESPFEGFEVNEEDEDGNDTTLLDL